MSPEKVRFFSRYAVVMLAVMVALYQLSLRNEGLSSWKGGGFGMYAEIHPIFNKVFIKSSQVDEPIDQQKVLSDESKDLMHDKILIFPKAAYLSKIKTDYLLNTSLKKVRVEVWGPVFDADSLTLEMQLLKAL